MSQEFSHSTRTLNLRKSSAELYDLLIIGGGINGAGIARDAASRGLKVFLAEGGDYASGTSSKSSKLIHGGIRYLENFEFHLVYEALNERHRLFEMAPHLVHPLKFMLPIYKESRVGMFKMGLGMWLYDALSLFQAPELHQGLNASETLSANSVLRSEDLCGSYTYYDAYMDDDRLVLETLRSAHALGARAANHCRVSALDLAGEGNLVHATLFDVLTDTNHSIRARHAVSSLGPWTDEGLRQLLPNWQPILRPTKGVHLTFLRDRLPLSSAIVMGAEERIVFAIPRHEMTIIGTTDTDYQGSPSQVSTSAEDINYLLQVAAHYFPKAKLTLHDIVATYAGVRPLVKDASGTTGKTSREHTILHPHPRLTVVAGGKYTTYRRMAQEIVASILRHFPAETKATAWRSQTLGPLNSQISPELYKEAQAEASGWSQQLTRAELQMLTERHGYEAKALIHEFPEASVWQIEAIHALRHSMCLHLKDFMIRRTPIFLARPRHGRDLIDSLQPIFCDFLGWSNARWLAEKTDYLAIADQDDLLHGASRP